MIEKAQLSATRALSEQQLQALTRESPPQSAVATPSPFGGLGGGPGAGAGGLGDLLGAIGGGAGGGAGGMGGLASMASLLGGGGAGGKGNLPSMASVTAMLPMLGSMAGLSPETIESGKEVLSAVTHVGGIFYGVFKRLVPFKDLLLAAAAALFIFISTRS